MIGAYIRLTAPALLNCDLHGDSRLTGTSLGHKEAVMKFSILLVEELLQLLLIYRMLLVRLLLLLLLILVVKGLDL